MISKTPKVDRTGRRTKNYEPSKNYYCYFIERMEEHFAVIAINTAGMAVDRFDFLLDYEGKSENEVLNECILSKIVNREDFKYCMAIYLLGSTEHLTPCVDVIKTNKEILIAESLSEESSTILFKFDNKLIASLYSHLHFPDADEETICQVINFDKVYSLTGNLYFECFEALQRIAIMNLEKII